VKERALSKSHELLLSIAKATNPHLTSPSPKVRLTLLDLLRKVSPLLARDENSFLPLINSVWPSVVSRIFGMDQQTAEDEVAYNVCAAAETVSVMCEGAGDFMTSRIEEIFPRLEKLYIQTYTRIKGSKLSKRATSSAAKRETDFSISEAVGRQPSTVSPVASPRDHPSLWLSTGAVRTSSSQVLMSIVDLLVSIISHVHLSEENIDKTFDMLAPFVEVPGKQNIRDVLVRCNADAVWAMEQGRKAEIPTRM